MKRAYICTNGCDEAQIASAHVEQFFVKNDWVITKNPTQADLIGFFACALTAPKEDDSIRIIRKLKSEIKPQSRLVVWGCLPKISPKSLAAVYDGPLVGPKDESFFEGILEKTKISMDKVSANTLVSVGQFHARVFLARWLIDHARVLLEPSNLIRTRSTFYILVGRGCTGHCTYCSDRCALGRIKSEPIEKIVSQFKRGLRMGYSRFYLVGTDLGPYGADIGCTLYDLLREMVEVHEKGNYKIVLPNINPFYLMEMYSDLKGIFELGKIDELGCQVESGSNRVLSLMGRMYTVEEWKKYMRRIIQEFPKIRLRTDFLVGFPTETDEDFRATLKLLDEIFLDYINIFKFSKRPRVYASYIPGQVPERIQDLRYRKLHLKALLNMAIKKTYRYLS